MKFLLFFLILVPSCLAQGSSWTQEETLIIYKKLRMLYETPSRVINQYLKRNPDAPDYHAKTRPNAPKVLRLAFHDCIPYDDGEPGELSGCDGCLNPSGMMIDMFEHFNTDSNMFNGPDVTLTNNNGLLFTADVLEQIWTDKSFPPGTDSLEVSMKESGKSRADLWAFAGLTAAHFGIEQNNLACQGQSQFTCGHVYALENTCELAFSSVPSFKTGRKDCESEGLERDFFTNRHEAHPNLHGNGPSTVDYYKEHFGITAREAIALTEGAHSFGKFNSQVSMLKYFWTRSQEDLLNNQLFRQIASRPQYFMDCKDPVTGDEKFQLVGDAYGNIPETTWVVNKLGHSVSGGPFQWFHRYDRCPASNECAAIALPDGLFRAEPSTPEHCCQDLDDGMQCAPDCQRSIQNDETAIAADAGFYHKFESDPETGEPSGCPGFDDPKWVSGKKKIVFPECPKEDYAPEGEPLYSIVDDYADNAQKWMDDFFPALAKMSANGYVDGDLTELSLDGLF